MKIKQIILLAEKILEILKLYENSTFKEMLDDIHGRLLDKNEKIGKETRHFEMDEVLYAISNMSSRDEIITYLNAYNKTDLTTLSKFANLKVRKEETKGTIIDTIANHYSFIALHDKMANRNKETVTAAQAVQK
ncbi:hypothetical protein [Anaeroselena agilis]|uniref:Uncharacterized protein n=1 Tax=Anaeroselena agilis TaxID=3063788 RepID=A0ABU3P2J4_9FIRM|nr:hypothetical protein [Selenomonadales bacterium 4137-cl]